MREKDKLDMRKSDETETKGAGAMYNPVFKTKENKANKR